ncbi:MAG TPA: hypothetical protein VMH83_15035 [Candidatus Acidoferrum sp.]|nr:hypothetical protein [Candidatus Acidoferrum sp.]
MNDTDIDAGQVAQGWDDLEAGLGKPIEGEVLNETSRPSIELPPTHKLLEPAIGALITAFKPHTPVSGETVASLSKVWGAVLDKWIPDFLEKFGVETIAVATTWCLLKPHFKKEPAAAAPATPNAA